MGHLKKGIRGAKEFQHHTNVSNPLNSRTLRACQVMHLGRARSLFTWGVIDRAMKPGNKVHGWELLVDLCLYPYVLLGQTMEWKNLRKGGCWFL